VTAGLGADPFLDFEPFHVAVGSAMVCGTLSTWVPWLVSPTATLVALALAGWVSRQRRLGTLPWHATRRGPTVALGILGAAAVGFFDPPGPLAPLRGLLLAGGLLPLYFAERSRSRGDGPVFSRL
jgi:hypothetical protein